jgi:hypothetical protein
MPSGIGTGMAQAAPGGGLPRESPCLPPPSGTHRCALIEQALAAQVGADLGRPGGAEQLS